MDKPRESAMQRIQVGVVGLVVVLLFVGIADLALDRAVETSDDQSDNATINASEITTKNKPPPEAPLSELGITPVVGGEKAAPVRLELSPIEQDLLSEDQPE